MKPEAQQLAIALALGWTEDPHRACCWLPPGAKKTSVFVYSDERPPPFVTDLNAMRSALMTLSDEEWIRYEAAIFNILEREGPQVCGRPRFLLSSAPQQAEAFLRTINLWTP